MYFFTVIPTMISISFYPLPAAHILLLGAVFVGMAYLIKPAGTPFGKRAALRVGILAFALAAMSGAIVHTRHAGTRLQTTYGWPKPIFARWIDPETQARWSAVVERGVVENLFFYGCASVLLVSMYQRARRR
jgi:hypothetical protein